MNLRQRIERLERHQHDLPTHPETLRLEAEARRNAQIREAIHNLIRNLAQNAWRRAGYPERALEVTDRNAMDEMQKVQAIDPECRERIRQAIRKMIERLEGSGSVGPSV